MNKGASRAFGSFPGAHGVGPFCRNKTTGETKLKWEPKELTDTELNTLNKEKIKEVDS